jgi:hypothetical protein
MKEMILLNEQATVSADLEAQQSLGTAIESEKSITPKQSMTYAPTAKQAEARPFAISARTKTTLTPQQKTDFLDYLEATWDGYPAALTQFNNQETAA